MMRVALMKKKAGAIVVKVISCILHFQLITPFFWKHALNSSLSIYIRLLFELKTLESVHS